MNKFPDIWGGGQLLAFSGIDGRTDFTRGLCLRTGFKGYEFYFMGDAGEPAPAWVRYSGPVERIELTGDFFRFYGPDGTTASGVLVDACHLLLEGDFDFRLNAEYRSVTGGRKTLIGRRSVFDPALLDADLEAAIAERGEFVRRAPLPEYASAAARRAGAKALSMLKTQVYSPEGLIRHFWSTPDRWPHRHIWLWDSVFHAIGMRHYRVDLARQFIDAMFDLQQPDGRIPHSGGPNHVRDELTQPPVLSLAIRLIDEVDPDPEWIARVAPRLERYMEWLFAHRDGGSGLLEWVVGGNPNCRSGESGMDNSPRFDDFTHLEAPDFNAFAAFECESLARFLPEKRELWTARCDRLRRLMNERLWSPEVKLYVDCDVRSGRRTGVMSSAGFLPLYCGAASPEQAAAMAAHLTDPKTFGTALRVPSIAANNVDAYSKDMWRGPVWININYLICLGLERYGFHELARAIARDTMAAEEKFFLKYGTFFEFYDDRGETDPPGLARKGSLDVGNPFHQAFHDYGWSGTLYLDMLNRPEWN